ncbi:MFS transporter [Iodobacter sp. HSC-16F04]|uniref:MFS transporter n=2 Tax=Iodobacter violaceini TaxID=3044271 RepID=A0ABX0KKK8_9NEIS|nr:MFS transporter [Iodobacter violacea]
MSMSEPASLRKSKAFILFWFTRVLSASGFQILSVALAWQVYSRSHQVLDLGLIGLAQFAPRLLFMLSAGDAADRYDRGRIVAISQLVQALTALALAWVATQAQLGREWIFLLAVILGTARTFEMPALQALLPGLVPSALLPSALATSSSGMQAATIISPALGGFLYVLGASSVYGISAALYLLALWLIMQIPAALPRAISTEARLPALLAGIRYIRSKPELLGAISLDLFAVLLGGATALLPVYAQDILLTGPVGLGALRSAPAVGALGMSVWLAWYPPQRRVGKLMFAAVALFGIATMVFGISRSFPLSILALVILGASDMISVVIRSSLVQLETPDEMRGRVSAVNALFIGASNQLGEFESGLTAAAFGTVPSVIMGGAGTLLVAGIWIKKFPALAKRDRLYKR